MSVLMQDESRLFPALNSLAWKTFSHALGPVKQSSRWMASWCWQLLIIWRRRPLSPVRLATCAGSTLPLPWWMLWRVPAPTTLKRISARENGWIETHLLPPPSRFPPPCFFSPRFLIRPDRCRLAFHYTAVTDSVMSNQWLSKKRWATV